MANPRLVNKQFNSPIGLYSEQNVREVLQREQQMLSNGAMGIDFHNSSVGKPANLQNSAVLRMLEEEEHRQRGGRAGNDEYIPRPLRDLTWPPQEFDQKNQVRSSFKDVVIPGAKRVAWPPPQEGVLDSPFAEQNAVQAQGGLQYPNQSPGLQQNSYSPQQAVPYQQSAAQTPYRPLKPLDVTSVGSGSPLASPHVNQSPQGFRPATPSKGWAPVHSPASTPLGSGAQKYFGAPAQQYQPQPQYQPVSQAYQQPGQQYQAPGQQYQQPSQQYQAPGQQYQAPSQQYQPQQQYQPPQQQYQPPQQQYQAPSQQYQSPNQQYQAPGQQYQAQSFAQPSVQQNLPQSQPAAAQAQVTAPRPQTRQVEPPPTTITLRPQAPVSQAQAPVYSAQPATASLKGGKHLRGDLKWPPENVRTRMEEDKIHLMELAKGPACRPVKQHKDYTPFFEQHALNSSYPGYKIPPGTQFFRPE